MLAAVIGSILPDVPITLLACVILARALPADVSFDSFRKQMDAVYFADPWCIAAHSLLHSPISIAFLFAATRTFELQKEPNEG